MHNHKLLISALTLTLVVGFPALLGAGALDAKPIPAHPDKLEFPPLEYQVPPAAQFREVLSNGMVVFIAEDRMLPTFDLGVTIRTGSAFDPPGKTGLAALMGEQLRDGGTENLTPEEFDERVEFLAAGIRSGVSDTVGSASISLLSKDIDAGLELLVDMLRRPRFDEERLRQAKDRWQQNIKRRNDSTSNIEGIEWSFLMNGEQHFSNRYPSSASVEAVTREDMLAFHQKYYHPGNMLLAVAGDFDRQEMLKKLERVFADWPGGEVASMDFPAPTETPTPGVYIVHKDEVNQGRVSIGHKSVKRGSPDEFPLFVMNAILGGSGFQSRITAKVRAREGLAYSAGSQFRQGVYYPGDFRGFFQSKTNACAYATQLVLEEIERLRTEKVTQDELDRTISLFAEFFPQRFPNKMALLGTYANDEYTGRDPAYLQTYVDNLKKVTVDDVLRVAREYLHPDQLVILAVGDSEGIRAGGHDKQPELTLDKFGKVRMWQPRDPDTLKR